MYKEGRFEARMEWDRLKSAHHGHSEFEASVKQTRGVPKELLLYQLELRTRHWALSMDMGQQSQKWMEP